ncbi:MAG: TrkA family potassium uptake protein [Chloroflexota bacterium]
MYIIIIGGGRVGYFLSKTLIQEGHEILVLEKNPVVFERINELLGSVCVRGDGCEAATLADVGTGRADMFVAVTGDDEDNLVSCQVAKHRFNVPRTIARLRNPRRETLFKKLGVDVTVSSTKIILEAIQHEVPTHPLIHLLDISDKGLEIVNIRIAAESTSVGKTVKELNLPKDSRLALIIPREGTPHVPVANTIIRENDEIIALTPAEQEEELRTSLTGA